MRLLVLSDSHGDIASINQAVLINSAADAVIHLGDYVKDIKAADAGGKKVYSVSGNCDAYYSIFEKEELLLTLCGVRILVCHGHKYGVKYSTDELSLRAAERNAQIALFGHTHIPERKTENGVLVFNPGSISKQKSRAANASYGIIDVENGEIIRAEIHLLAASFV